MNKPTGINILKALDVLLGGVEPSSASRHGLELQGLRKVSQKWATSEHILGYGWSARSTSSAGRYVAIYMDSSDSVEIIAKRLPKTLQLPGMAPVPVQAINVGNVRPFSQTGKIRPVQPGYSIGHPTRNPGTIGLIVKKNGADTNRYVLSAGHVLAPVGRDGIGDDIIQPGAGDDGVHPADTIGTLSDVMEIQYNNTLHLNYADAALCKINDNVQSIRDVEHIGLVNTVANTVRTNAHVTISGRTSTNSTGMVLDSSARIRIPYEHAPGSTAMAGFVDVVRCTPFSRPGDSGAVVVNSKREAVGLILAGSDVATFFCKMRYIVNRFDISI